MTTFYTIKGLEALRTNAIKREDYHTSTRINRVISSMQDFESCFGVVPTYAKGQFKVNINGATKYVRMTQFEDYHRKN